MRSAIRSLRKHQFFTLSFGVAAANAISFASMPLLARLFGSESFGIFAVYYSLSNLIGLPATFRFELAVPIAESEREADQISTFATLLTIAVAAAVAILFLFHPLREVFNTMPEGYLTWALTAASVLIVGVTQVLVQRCIRMGRVKNLSVRPVVERLGFTIFALIAYKMNLAQTGLIWAQTLASFAAVLSMTAVFWRPVFSLQSVKKYLDFPKKNLLSALLQLASSQLPMVIYARYFSATELGFLSLAQRLIDSPISLLSSSMMVVYYRRLLLADRGQFKRIFVRTLTLGVMILAPPCLIAGFFADPILNFLFGVKWTASHIFFVVLLPLAFSKMLFSIHQSFFIVLRKLGVELSLSIALFSAQFFGIVVGLGLGESLLIISGLSASIMAIVYLAGLGAIFRLVQNPPEMVPLPA